MRGMLSNRLAPSLSQHCFSSLQTSSSFSSLSPIKPWLLIGLGNPGDKYESTRHNVGFDMIDAFAVSAYTNVTLVFCDACSCFSIQRLSECVVLTIDAGMVDGIPVLLAKPQTYMNLSGESVGPLAAYYELPLNRVLVAFDDMDLPCGVLRLQPKGGFGRHNGLKSVIYHFRRNREFCRLRIGIGRPPGQMDPKAFVLQKFNKSGRKRIDSVIKEGVNILKMVATKGLTEAARLSNADQKYKHLRSHDLQD